MPRPNKLSTLIGDEICTRLIEGESLRSICLSDKMPHAAVVCRWLGDEENIEFRQQYARAREAQADTITDEILLIADTTEEGVETVEKPDGSVETRRGDMIQHRRLRIDARKWYASKLAPKKYGDRQALELTGSVDLTLRQALLELKRD